MNFASFLFREKSFFFYITKSMNWVYKTNYFSLLHRHYFNDFHQVNGGDDFEFML